MNNSRPIDYSSNKIVNNRNRTILTVIIIVFGIALMTLLAILTILKATDKYEASQWVFNAIIPLIASWIGTVIAFYFGRDNFDAATQQVLALTKDTLDDINVENIMINVKTIVARKVDSKDDVKNKLSEIIDLYNRIDKDRIPIFSTELIPRYIIHRANMNEYVARKKDEENKVNELTLKNIIDDNKEKFSYNKEKGFVTVSKTNSVKEALEKMNKIEDCQDVFITENGKETGKVLGWLTNSLINRFLTVKTG